MQVYETQLWGQAGGPRHLLGLQLTVPKICPSQGCQSCPSLALHHLGKGEQVTSTGLWQEQLLPNLSPISISEASEYP